jgi:hypothetical protein
MTAGLGYFSILGVFLSVACCLKPSPPESFFGVKTGAQQTDAPAAEA